ncbi:hypothetical protein LC608_35825 [Nostoc sp. XA010]|uniref:hypothetical protein n=1 Tax=Nostoc sp. XA010 TaxID=2780407 RepID=UPI001E60042E|nr:hypothetical protein [Nostoc sp. XA010]MCC5662184.1 hypothetical protein [Nostoc sp. XA010]
MLVVIYLRHNSVDPNLHESKLAWTIGLLTVAIAIGGLASVSAQNPYTTQSKEQEKIFFLPHDRPKSGVGWEITTTSGEAEIALARHLANMGIFSILLIR